LFLAACVNFFAITEPRFDCRSEAVPRPLLYTIVFRSQIIRSREAVV
jgi:hypothetical protein